MGAPVLVSCVVAGGCWARAQYIEFVEEMCKSMFLNCVPVFAFPLHVLSSSRAVTCLLQRDAVTCTHHRCLGHLQPQPPDSALQTCGMRGAVSAESQQPRPGVHAFALNASPGANCDAPTGGHPHPTPPLATFSRRRSSAKCIHALTPAVERHALTGGAVLTLQTYLLGCQCRVTKGRDSWAGRQKQELEQETNDLLARAPMLIHLGSGCAPDGSL